MKNLMFWLLVVAFVIVFFAIFAILIFISLD